MKPGSVDMLWAGALSLGPGMVWLYYLYRLERRRPEPLWLVLAAFLAGAASTQAVLGTMEVMVPAFPSAARPGPTPLAALFYFTVWVGLVEETWKLLAVRLTVYYSRTFDQPADGLVYAGAAALGFATAENASYLLRFGEPSILLDRWLLSTFGHVLMASFWGYGLGIAKAGPPEARRRFPVLGGLALSAAAHGLYDWLLFLGWLPAAVLLLLGLWKLFMNRLREAARLSPHRSARGRRLRPCPECRALVRTNCSWCTACGRPVDPARPDEGFCPACLHSVEDGRPECGECGCRLVEDPRDGDSS